MKVYAPIFVAFGLVLAGQECCGTSCDADDDGRTTADGDCNDDDASIHPGATEICYGLDNDCDGSADSSVIGTDPSCAGIHCQDILEQNPTATDGVYWIDPEQSGCLANSRAVHIMIAWQNEPTLARVHLSNLGDFFQKRLGFLNSASLPLQARSPVKKIRSGFRP